MYHLTLATCTYQAYPQLQQFYDDLPIKPYSSDSKDFCEIRSKAAGSKRPYIQSNHPLVIKWLVIDIDSPLKNTSTQPYYDENLLFRCYDRDLAEPNFIARNRKNGHVQYFYRLTDPVTMFTGSHAHPMRYLKALQYAYNVQLGGDMAFGGSLAKNPLDTETWDIFLTGAGSYTLNELAEYIDLNDPQNKPPKKAKNDDHISPFAGLGRNCDTFDYLRFIAYSIAHNMTYTALYKHLLALAIEFNSRFKQPLLLNEITCICRSIARFCESSPKYQEYTKLFSEKQAEKGRKGGLVSDSSKGGLARSAGYNSKREQTRAMFNNGINKSQIAQQLNVSRPTIHTWLKNQKV